MAKDRRARDGTSPNRFPRGKPRSKEAKKKSRGEDIKKKKKRKKRKRREKEKCSVYKVKNKKIKVDIHRIREVRCGCCSYGIHTELGTSQASYISDSWTGRFVC
jgi:hypothetical protein